MKNRHLIITIYIGVYIRCLVPDGAHFDDEYNYEQDLCELVQAFRLETHTPQARVFKQDNALGIVTLLLPGQQELTPSQYCWKYWHGEVTGFECGWFLEVE